MFDQLFRNMTPVVKNLFFINLIVFVAVWLASFKGIDLAGYLALHHYNSEGFFPFQYVTSMFLHTDLFHIFANMLGLISFGTSLERFIGAKRMLILYLVSGLVGNLFYHGFHMAELWFVGENVFNGTLDYKDFIYPLNSLENKELVSRIVVSKALGASGAVFGIFAGVFRYFPNTEVMLLFPPIPLKIKWLFIVLMVGSVVLSVFPFMMQGIAHMAHFGGGLAGLLLVEIWQKDKTRFY